MKSLNFFHKSEYKYRGSPNVQNKRKKSKKKEKFIVFLEKIEIERSLRYSQNHLFEIIISLGDTQELIRCSQSGNSTGIFEITTTIELETSDRQPIIRFSLFKLSKYLDKRAQIADSTINLKKEEIDDIYEVELLNKFYKLEAILYLRITKQTPKKISRMKIQQLSVLRPQELSTSQKSLSKKHMTPSTKNFQDSGYSNMSVNSKESSMLEGIIETMISELENEKNTIKNQKRDLKRIQKMHKMKEEQIERSYQIYKKKLKNIEDEEKQLISIGTATRERIADLERVKHKVKNKQGENEKRFSGLKDEATLIDLMNDHFKMKYMRNEKEMNLLEKKIKREADRHLEEEETLVENELYLKGNMAQSYLNPFRRFSGRKMIKAKSCSDLAKNGVKENINGNVFKEVMEKKKVKEKELDLEFEKLKNIENFMVREIERLEGLKFAQD